MFKLFVLSYAILLLYLSSRSCSAPVSKRGDIQLCGRMLAEALNLLCQGEYYDPEEENNISKRNPKDDHYPGWPLGRSRRQEGGVVDECCRQACPLSVLISYCRNGK